MTDFVREDSVVRRIWGRSETVLFIFAGASAEFALNKAVDWLYFTGKLPADPLGRLFSTVGYAKRIVFASEEQAHAAIDTMRQIHTGVENKRGASIPDWAYRDVLYMLIFYSMASYELLERKLTAAEKDEVYDVFFRLGTRMGLKELPVGYADWLNDREAHLDHNLAASPHTKDLFKQYKKHLGTFRYAILIEAQKLLVPRQVRKLLQFGQINWLWPVVPVYKFSCKVKLDGGIKAILLPAKYKKEISGLDVTMTGQHSLTNLKPSTPNSQPSTLNSQHFPFLCTMICSINDFKNPFFIGVAGTGMSALAQYLKGIGKEVSGSDRFFTPGVYNETQEKLEAEGIRCFVQDGTGITDATDLVVCSTAIEDTVIEVQKARQLNIPILRRSELLALIAASKKTIAVGGTSGKSTTSAMLFDILEKAGLEPSIISGAGLISIIREGKIGNAKVGAGELLVIEADESDGSIVQYKPEIGLLLNIDKDHQEIDELLRIFGIFKTNSRKFITNQSHPLAAPLSAQWANDFATDSSRDAGYTATDFSQEGMEIRFTVNNQPFSLHLPGKHNMENAVAATAVAHQLGVELATCAAALKNYEGIYRRHQVLGQKQGVWMIDDYAHNPVKCAAAIAACQPIAPKVIAWFQPHGYKPTKFLRADFVKELAAALRPEDEIWMSEIFYAGGTAVKDISANDLINDLKALGKNAFFAEHRNDFMETVRPHLGQNTVLLLMGARDPSLEQFAKDCWEKL